MLEQFLFLPLDVARLDNQLAQHERRHRTDLVRATAGARVVIEFPAWCDRLTALASLT